MSQSRSRLTWKVNGSSNCFKKRLRWSFSAATKHETRLLWCGFGLVTNILQSLKTAFDDQPNFHFLSLIPFFLIALLCPTLKWMLSFTDAYTFQIFARCFLSWSFCQLLAKACTLKTISSKVSYTTLPVIFAALLSFSFHMTMPSNFQAAFVIFCCTTKSCNSFSALQCKSLVFGFVKYCVFPKF